MKAVIAGGVCLALLMSRAFAAEFSVELTPRGNQFILAKGEIAETDADALTRLLRSTGLKEPMLAMDSGGGSVLGGIALGRAIRANGLSTIVLAGSECMSACAFAFIGGADRIVADGGFYGVHQFRYARQTDSDSATSSTQQITAELIEYFAQMGVGSGLVSLAMRVPPERIRVLSPEELGHFHVTYDRSQPHMNAGDLSCLPKGWKDPLGLSRDVPPCKDSWIEGANPARIRETETP